MISKDLGYGVEPEIMIPLTGEEKELRYAKQVALQHRGCEEVFFFQPKIIR
jgi:hypothetical protein